MPARTAAGTEPGRSVLPSTGTVPAVGAARAVDRLEDLRAAGADQPGQADDLAGVHGQVDVGELAGAQARPRTSSTGSPRSRGLAGRGGKTYSMERPVISRISSEVGVSLTSRPVATVLPSLSTVTRSPIWRISSSRCEM